LIHQHDLCEGMLMKRIKLCVWAAILGALAAGSNAAANVLTNSGFETGAALGNPPDTGAAGWTTFGNANTASANLNPVRSGVGSLQLVGGGNFSVPGAFQTVPASPGQIWDLQGYMLTQNQLPANATFGLLKIVWSNGTNDLPPAQILIGQAGPAANPGIESLPILNAASTLNTWQFTQARGVAPPGTTQVSFFALFVDESAGTGFFDDLQATLIPEPTSFALVGLGGVALFGALGRRRVCTATR
jgi:hypothetical protein